jgi:hypothetical protein
MLENLPPHLARLLERLEARLEAVTSPPSPAGDLSLGHILHAAGLDDLGEVILLRHTIRPKDPASLRELSEQGVLAYTRIQTRKTNIFPKEPPPLWLVFVAEGERGTHSRFFTAYENGGELADEGTTETRSQVEFLELGRGTQDRAWAWGRLATEHAICGRSVRF